MDVFKVRFGENDDKEKWLTTSKYITTKRSLWCNWQCRRFSFFFQANNRLPFIQSAHATACRHSWGVTLQCMMGPQPNGTTGGACTEKRRLFCICSKAMGAFWNHIMMPRASLCFVCAQQEPTENEPFKSPTNTHKSLQTFDLLQELWTYFSD